MNIITLTKKKKKLSFLVFLVEKHFTKYNSLIIKNILTFLFLTVCT